MRVHFLELLLLKCNENDVFVFKITQNKVKGSFFPFFLNKILDKVYSNQLKICNPANRNATAKISLKANVNS